MESDLKLQRIFNPSFVPQDPMEPRYEIHRFGSRPKIVEINNSSRHCKGANLSANQAHKRNEIAM